MCIFTSHLNYPRDIIYKKFNKEFQLDGYGKYFDKNIVNHNNSNFFKFDILKNYKLNLCPANSIYPGYYIESIVESFDALCMPITWADQNISMDFNPKSFININDDYNNIDKLISLIKNKDYLKRLNEQPLFIKKPNLELEFKFIKKIIDTIG